MCELLAHPEAWTQGANARNKDGLHCSSTDAAACSFCLYGAIFKCYPEEIDAVVDRVLSLILPHYPSIIAFNDDPERTHAEILALLKESDL